MYAESSPVRDLLRVALQTSHPWSNLSRMERDATRSSKHESDESVATNRTELLTIRERLCTGELSDAEFDALLPGDASKRASFYWTPISVARHAARFFRAHGGRRVLDVGAGAGKFCVAAAASQPGMQFVGVERRGPLVQLASSVARQLELPNASFVHSEAFDCAWSGFDGVYFFNPFSENLSPDEEKFDLSSDLSLSRLLSEMKAVSEALRRMPLGTLLVSYHGIGAPIPSGYELVCDEPAGTDRLRAWLRSQSADEAWYHLETDRGIERASREEVEETARRWDRCARAQ